MARPMKHSGIEWIGDFPADWELVQLKRFVSVNNGREVPEEIQKTADAVPVYGSGGVFKYTTDYLYDGEAVMFGRKGTLGKPLYVNERFWTVDTMYYLTFSDKLFAKFNYYQLCAFDWEPHITQTALPSIVASEIVSCKFAFPSLAEQQRIAAFLDDKCARIDSIISKTRASVEEYKKLKQAIITRAVTKGLRPNRPMKHSGIEWLGDIPADWKLSKIKNNFIVHSGATPKSDVVENWDGDIVWITPADYKTVDKYVSQGKRNISEIGYRSCAAMLVPRGSIIFSKRAPIGTVAIAAIELCTNQGCLSCVPKADTDSVYYFYVMSVLTEQFNLYGTGTTFKEISYDVFRSFKVPRPPLAEQREIAAYLDAKTAAIDSLVAKKNRLVSELASLKKSLIFEYVTGKKGVPA